MLCFHYDDIPSERSAFFLHLLWSIGQATHRAAGDVFFPPHLRNHHCMFFCINSQRQQACLELNYSAPATFFKLQKKAAKEQLSGLSGAFAERVNPTNFKKMKQISQAPQKHLTPRSCTQCKATSDPVSSFCSFPCYTLADYIISKEAESFQRCACIFLCIWRVISTLIEMVCPCTVFHYSMYGKYIFKNSP